MYKHWLDIFYPRPLPARAQLPFYAERFDTVEVNYSFYRLPPRSVFEQWRAQTPPAFLFAVKGSRYLTHQKKLKEPEEPLRRLMESAGGLEEKLGPILFQFPQTWRLNLERLVTFVDALRAYPGPRFAFEFRHGTWLTPHVYELLHSIDAALVLPISPTVPIDIRLTANWTYIRFHTGKLSVNFEDEELRFWAQHLATWRADGVDAYVYFNNDPGGHALWNAETLKRMLV